MSGTTWTKFYWSDWLSEPALRLCSYAARGLWMDMLCIAATHDPIGYVAVAGRGLDETSIARMTGGQESEVSALLGELERNGVFSRDRQRRIYSRRMVSDARKVAEAKKNGKLGGNPTLGNKRGNSASVNPSDMGVLKPHKPEASTQNKLEEATASLSPKSTETAEPPELFEDAWKAYPHLKGRSSKKLSLAQWRRLPPATREALPAAVRRYAAEGREPKAECGAPAMERWLRDEKFADWMAESRPPDIGADWPEARWRVAVDLWRGDGAWDDRLGPTPGQPGCRVPPNLLIQQAAHGSAA